MNINMLPLTFPVALFLIIVVIYLFSSAVRVLREYERGVVFRLGRLSRALFNPGGNGNGPGLMLLLPLIDKMVKVSLRTVAMDVPSQDTITRDNVSLKVNAVIYFRVMDPERAVVAVEDYLFATSQIAQTTLRSVLGQSELDELLAERDRINQKLQRIIDEHTEPWGIKVSAVEVKFIDLPQEMQRAMARQAEAEREKRAKIIHAEGELQASEKLAQAAKVIASEPVTIQLRYLQTLTEIGTEKNTTVVFPLPIDIVQSLMGTKKSAEVK
jgi:regulator of protease activity HflC (stomatin/prohibitin superfamily)